MKKKSAPNPKANHNILMLTYLFAAVFVGMLVYFAYFLGFKSEDVINNTYNARLDSFSDRIVRGSILSSDGTVLAHTTVGEDGSETRHYPLDELFTHAVGYSSQGKTGLEALANFYLLSSHINLVEQTYNELTGQKNPGDTVVTTLDVGLQRVAYDALGDRRGTVIVMEPDTGKILVMVSKPDFNPNTVGENWEALISEDNTSGQLLNRATQGLYPPGSTFKIVTALEYIREHPGNYGDFHFDCNGILNEEDYQIRCYHNNAHGSQDLKLAFANSCNGAFAKLGQNLNLTNMNSLAKQLLFNTELPLSIPYSKSAYQMKAGAGTWDILQTSIGQGATQITPMHNAMITAAIANGGILMKPYLVDHVETVSGESVKKFLPSSYGSLMRAEESAVLTEFMREVVTVGTGSGVRTDAYTVAGKTGSAEFETGKESHAWFTGFAPAENPGIVVCVLVEEAGSGGREAAPIARKIFDSYFQR